MIRSRSPSIKSPLILLIVSFPISQNRKCKKVKNGVKAIPQYLQGESIAMPQPDPDDYNEDEAWNDVKKAKE